VKTLFRDATLLSMKDRSSVAPESADVLIDGDLVGEVAPAGTVDAGGVDRVIDASDLLLMPGMVNAHIHTEQNTFRGRYPGLPLEVLMLYAYPLTGAAPLDAEMIHLRTLLAGVESLKSGVTTILDDVMEVPHQGLEQLGSVFGAYEQVGMRANVSGHVINRPFFETIPYLEESLPDGLREKFLRIAPISLPDYMDFCAEAVSRFHGSGEGRLRYVVAPSGPQRCTEELLGTVADFSRSFEVPFHIHILETRVQRVTGTRLYGKTLIRLMSDLGALHRMTSIAHAIWIDEDDIGLIASSGASVAHNPVCNLRIGSGIAPLRSLLKAGVNVALGTDGISSNDSCRLFDVMKAAGIVHTLSTDDYEEWPSAAEILWAATRGGARAVGLDDQIGSIERGKKADLVALDLCTSAFVPVNDLANQLVYAENGSSVRLVMVGGDVVVEDGRCTKIDETAVLREARSVLGGYLKQHALVEDDAHELEPYLRAVIERCAAEQRAGLTVGV
jgi:cytosine/adenosine deaminase-related metal-dependent hydrolase